LVGIPGCGKSTYAKTLENENTVVLSSDLLRKEILKDEQSQANNSLIFETLYARARENIKNGKNVVVDATNVVKEDRAKLLENFADLDISRKAIVVQTPIEICIERDKNRDRTVGEDVIFRMVESFELPSKEEGFDEIIFIDDGCLV